MSRLVGAVARILMAPVFIKGGINQVKKAHRLAPAVDAALEEYGIEVSASGEKLVKLNGIGMTVAGGALTLGVFPRTSALTLAGLLVPTTIVGQAFWKEEDERKRSARLSGALSNAAIIGGLLLVAARRRR
ncbi:DoxX family protein [Actinomyces dentalis]|uniref:DoxX family protein n=1 Tax=Actinomyces dentalis TaxID=272548 RepID=UPI0028E982D1|nr:DoxX family protein [Actinomyces dentalis]